MEMKAHLTDEEFAQAWDEPRRNVSVHLENCEACRAELQRLRASMELQPSPARDGWDRQRQEIWRRIEATNPSPKHPGLRWSMAFAALILFALTLVMNSGNHPPEAKPAQTQARVDPDHELLLEVEQIVSSEGPMALQPAGLLTEEQVHQGSAAVTQESTHAN